MGAERAHLGFHQRQESEALHLQEKNGKAEIRASRVVHIERCIEG